MSITTTGNGRIDTATAEIAVALRDANPGKRDQHYYDEAMRLRREILAGASEAAAYRSARQSTPPTHCFDDLNAYVAARSA